MTGRRVVLLLALCAWPACRPSPGPRAAVQPGAPSVPQTASQHWKRARALARTGRCGPAIFHLAVALRLAGGGRLPWNRDPDLTRCVRLLSPPTRQDKTTRVRDLVPSAGLAGLRLRVSAGTALVGADERTRTAWQAWQTLLGTKPGPASSLPRLRRTRVGAFWISATEVTWLEWKRCVAARVCRPRHGPSLEPVRGVSVTEARAFCRWRGGRLPTQAEWVRAARGGSSSLYPWGDWWRSGCTNVGTSSGPDPVGTNPCDVSAFGLADMGGNVAELVSRRPGDGGQVLVQGASWKDGPMWALVGAVRTRVEEVARVGFRCVWPED